MDEHNSTSLEGNPSIEQAEQNALGTNNYQKVEVVHRFADSHPWLHPLLGGIGIVLVIGIGLFVWQFLQKKSN